MKQSTSILWRFLNMASHKMDRSFVTDHHFLKTWNSASENYLTSRKLWSKTVPYMMCSVY